MIGDMAGLERLMVASFSMALFCFNLFANFSVEPALLVFQPLRLEKAMRCGPFLGVSFTPHPFCGSCNQAAQYSSPSSNPRRRRQLWASSPKIKQHDFLLAEGD